MIPWGPAAEALAKTIGVEIVKAILAGKPVRKLVLTDALTIGTTTSAAKLEAEVKAAAVFGARPPKK